MLVTIECDRSCIACMLGGDGERTPFMIEAELRGTASSTYGSRTGQELTAQAPAPGVGWPYRR
jgi:hypothetical protein